MCVVRFDRLLTLFFFVEHVRCRMRNAQRASRSTSWAPVNKSAEVDDFTCLCKKCRSSSCPTSSVSDGAASARSGWEQGVAAYKSFAPFRGSGLSPTVPHGGRMERDVTPWQATRSPAPHDRGRSHRRGVMTSGYRPRPPPPRKPPPPAKPPRKPPPPAKPPLARIPLPLTL
jgi:hypothetical protein